MKENQYAFDIGNLSARNRWALCKRVLRISTQVQHKYYSDQTCIIINYSTLQT